MSFNPYSEYTAPSSEQNSHAQHTRNEGQSVGGASPSVASQGGAQQATHAPDYAQSFMSGQPFNSNAFSANMSLSNPGQQFRQQLQHGGLGAYGAGNGHLSQHGERDTQYNAYFDQTVPSLSMSGYSTHLSGSHASGSNGHHQIFSGLPMPTGRNQSPLGNSSQQQQQRSGSTGGLSQDAAKYAYMQTMQAAKQYGYPEQAKSHMVSHAQQSQGNSSNPSLPQIPTPTIPTLSTPRSASTSTPPAAKKQKVATKRGFSKKPDIKDEVESDEEYNMEGMKTKSGRKVHKPSQFNPSKAAGGRRRGGPQKKQVLDSLFCKVCERGHSPKSNMIVFCDGCNEPYHQLCHLPVIDNMLVTLPDAEWFCSACDEKRGQRPLEMGSTGADLTEEQKKTYLASLPTSHLVELVLTAAKQAPQLQLFAPETRNILDAIHAKQEQAIAEERVRLLGQEYGPGDEYVPPVSAEDEACNVPGQPPMEQIVVRAIQTLAAPNGSQTKEIIEWVERNYSMPDASFRVKVAQQIASCVRKGRLEQLGTAFKVNPGYRATVKVGPAALPLGAQPGNGRAGTRHAGDAGGNLAGYTNEAQMYPVGAGIQLPPESAADGFSMVETDSPAFTHRQS